tara:strand:- start:61 stop:864 length:804 start_codon:yes stop_codon:yes gene_type:complete
MNKFRVACFQTNSSDIPEENIIMLEKIFSNIRVKSLDLICLPECVSIFSDSRTKINNYFENWHQIFLDFIINKAKEFQTNILIGSFPYKNKNKKKFLNRSLIICEKGKILSHYDKINLFDVLLDKNEKYFESKNYDPGKRLKVIKLPWGNLGMSICYDLRFPNLFKSLAKRGAHFFSIPAAFTYTTGKSHWHTLIRARAIENGCFIFAPAQCGIHKNGRKTFGHSLIVDPWGKVIAEAQSQIDVIEAQIDIELVRKVRKKIPSMTTF